MMAAVFTKGETVIGNAALEPEIDDLAHFINSMGGKISGIGTSKIVVHGVDSLHETTYEAIGDRIEAGTYLMAALATNSEIEITKSKPHHLEFVIDVLKNMGAKIECTDDSIKVFKHQGLKGCKVDTAPFPGFPTDLQAQLMALCTLVNGSSVITENIFENRFMHVPELTRLGADITLKGKSAFITGGKPLSAAPVMCTDLRASAALVIAALGATGETHVQRIYHLDRGYEKLVDKLTSLGANLTRAKE
jgi:UDP-N-acetylglucosamine 1-carboxyvinyltransferase